MAIYGAQILHEGNGFLLERGQTLGLSSLNLPTETVREVGNNRNVGIIRDTADLTFDIESWDMTTAIEAILTGLDPGDVVDGQEFDFNDAMPLDVVAPWKSARNAYDIVGGGVFPALTLESAAYRFGVGQSSAQTFSLRGDTAIYAPSTPVFERKTLVSATSHAYTFGYTPATKYVEQGEDFYAYNVCVVNRTTKKYKRLVHGSDYTDSTGGFTIVANWALLGYDQVQVEYATTAAGAKDDYPQSVHSTSSMKPAAIRGKDVDVYVSDGAATPTYTRWGGVQTAETNWRVTLDKDEELGSSKVVSQDYDTPTVSGTVALKPFDPADFFSKLNQVSGRPSTEAIGVYSTIPLGLEIRVSDPDTGDRLKTLYVPDARFTVPAFQARVSAKQTMDMQWTSEEGLLYVYAGERG